MPAPWRPDTIRVRLGLALALALLPVLFLSGLQSALTFQAQVRSERANLTAAAVRSVAVARARIESAQVLLETLAPRAVGLECAQRLNEVAQAIHGYENLIAFDASGRVVCASSTVPADAARASRPWFRAVAGGAPVAITSAPGASYAAVPSLFAAVPATDAQGRFNGELAAVMSLASLRPDLADPTLPAGSEVALMDPKGQWLSATDISRFPQRLDLRTAPPSQGELWMQADRTGHGRIYALATLVPDEVQVAISAPAEGILTWAWLNPLSSLALPLLAFSLALVAVLAVAEQQVVRWIAYLQRIAAIYARGRFSVRSVQAERAPPEIRDLAETLDAMAAAIVMRDATEKEHLAQKDALLLEIHHRVKNNLQIISSLLSMQQRALTDPAARAAIYETRQRIAALALIYRTLYQGPDLYHVDLSEFLEELVGQLVASDGGAQPAVRSEFACDPLIVEPDRLAPIALFAVEAISNARKHGLDEGGRLNVVFRVRDGEAELAIADTGHAGHTSRLGVGVGRTLMTAFARQLRGEVSFRSNPDGGLTARLSFPAQNDRAPGPAHVTAIRAAAH
ncbi:MAG TPA: sensor histidine kinase [Caulobacteraceae bacterium]